MRPRRSDVRVRDDAAREAIRPCYRSGAGGLPSDMGHLPLRPGRGGGASDLGIPITAAAPETAQQALEMVVRGALAERASQVGTALREEAGVEAALGGEPGPRAAAAERAGDRCDHTHLAAAVGVAIAGCHLARIVRRLLLERPGGV